MAMAKQDPQEKARRVLASDGKMYFSYADIHKTICSLVPGIREFKPDVILAIGGGGYIPARMLRTELKIPILAISLELYDDATCTARSQVKKMQWFDEKSGVGKNVRGKRVLIVDEVDDSRKTLSYCVEEVKKTNCPAAIAVAVVHNKIKEKKASLPDDVKYFAGDHVSDLWNCYPWDAAAYGRGIDAHEALASGCRGGGSRGEGSGDKKVAARGSIPGAQYIWLSLAFFSGIALVRLQGYFNL
jgi:hypoxanthine phosphoribosyltransferase